MAPRLGAAWDPTGEGRTVVRGGFGVFYDALAAIPLLALERSTGARTAQIPDPGTTDVDALMIDPASVPPAVWTQKRIETPMTRQYSAGVEHTLPGGTIVRIDGLLVQGRNLLLQRHLNPLLPEGGPTYTGFGSVLQVLSKGRAEAKMLLLEARRAFLGGWFSVGYTLADRKNTNDTWGGGLVPQTDPDRLDLNEEWGPAAWDERHRLVGTGGIELPFGLSAVAKVVYSSARPFTAITGNNDNGDTDAFNDRPPGEGRNARRGPDYFRADLRLTWAGAGPGSIRTTVELNAYNLFNHVNGMPSSVQNVVGAPRFGEALAAFPARQLEVGLRMEWQ